MNRIPIRIVKVGGSLLEWPDLAAALQHWLAEQPAAKHVLIVGGGRLADEIRQLDQRFGLSPQVSHNLCLEVLRITARLVAALLANNQILTDLDQVHSHLETATPRSTAVFCPYQFTTEWEPQNHSSPLPASWDVTSDSIAARIAEVLQADELVLLKSADPPPDDAPVAGYVDAYFDKAANKLPNLRFINLRNMRFDSADREHP